MEIANNAVQFIASNPILLFVVGLLSLLSLYLTLTVARQRKQLAVLKAPPRRRYGFLGKPLYSFMIVALLVGGVGVTYFSNQSTAPATVNADTEVTINVKYSLGKVTAEGVTVNFSVVPSINGSEWAGSNATQFDAFWTGIGATGFSQVELELTQNNPGGFSKVLRSGSYQITVDIVVSGRRINKTITLEL